MFSANFCCGKLFFNRYYMIINVIIWYTKKKTVRWKADRTVSIIFCFSVLLMPFGFLETSLQLQQPEQQLAVLRYSTKIRLYNRRQTASVSVSVFACLPNLLAVSLCSVALFKHLQPPTWRYSESTQRRFLIIYSVYGLLAQLCSPS